MIVSSDILQKLEFSCGIARRLAYLYFLFILLPSFMDTYGQLQYCFLSFETCYAFFFQKYNVCMPVNVSSEK